MDWQVLAALTICGISLVAYLVMGPGRAPASVVGQDEDVAHLPPLPREPHDTQVDADVLARFTAALQRAQARS